MGWIQWTFFVGPMGGGWLNVEQVSQVCFCEIEMSAIRIRFPNYNTISYSTNSLTLYSFTLLVYTMLRNVLTLLTILTLSVKAQDPHAGHDHGSADGDNGWEWIGAFDLRK